MKIKLISILTLFILAMIFVAQNVGVVEINFLLWKISMSSALLIFFALLAGFALGWSLQGYLRYRKSRIEYEYLH